jgi:hypothetical protein
MPLWLRRTYHPFGGGSRLYDAGMMRRPEVGRPPVIEASKINFFAGIFKRCGLLSDARISPYSKKTVAVVT